MSKLASIPLFGIGNQGKSANATAQKRVNLYVEVQKDAEKHILTMYPTAGLVGFADIGSTPIRGVYETSDAAYVVHQATLYKVLNNGSYSSKGTLSTNSNRVDIAFNGTQLLIVDGANGYTFNVNTEVFAKITDVDFPGADTCIFKDGFFIINKPNSGQFYISTLYDGASWEALDFATDESSPDNIVRVFEDGGDLIIFNERTTGFYGNSGAVDFPFSRIGSSSLEWGLAARWSLCKFMDSVVYLRKNRLGQAQVCMQSGTNVTAVSSTDMDTVMAGYANIADATAFSYMLGGHPFYQINFPSAGESWLFDGQSQSWSKLESSGGRHRAEMLFNLVNKPYVTDYENGKIYRLDPDTYTDNGAFVVREFTSRHQSTGNYSRLAKVWLEMEAGVGLQTGQGSNPQIMMTVSKDGGKTFSNEQWREFGRVGEYTARPQWNRLGRARDWVFKFRVTDPVKTVFLNAYGQYG